MNDIVMGNVTPLKKRIRELEDKVTRLEKVLSDLQWQKDYDRDMDYSDPYWEHPR